MVQNLACFRESQPVCFRLTLSLSVSPSGHPAPSLVDPGRRSLPQGLESVQLCEASQLPFMDWEDASREQQWKMRLSPL